MSTPRHAAAIRAAAALALVTGATQLAAQSFTFSGSVDAGGLVIPDNNLSGIASSLHISNPGISIESLTVHLQISGGLNGDYYAYLSHEGHFSVLLNRAGRTAVNPDGYFDSGFDVALVPFGGAGDIHQYQSILNPLGGPIVGTWDADARNVDPAATVNTSPRTAGLGKMLASDPNGEWVLFIADLNSGGEGKLAGWSIEGVAVPEPGEWASVAAGALLGLAVWRRLVGRVRRA